MNAFGRVLDTTAGGGMPSGGLIEIEVNPGTVVGYPDLNPVSLHNGQELMMFQQGAVANPPAQLLHTKHASGGCVPICAAEITPPGRQVNWIYLMHGHGGNPPVDVAAAAGNVLNVYMCMLVYNGAASLWDAQNGQGYYFSALDPSNAIPNANALLIYGNHTKMAITRQAMIAVDF